MPCLTALHIPIGVLEQTEHDVLDIFADITRFSERGRVHDGERHVEYSRKCLGQQRLTRPRRPIRRMFDFESSTSPPRCLFI